MTDNITETSPKTYIAVELLPQMTTHEVAEAVIRGGKTVGTWFRHLERLGVIEVAARKFVRFRTDLEDPMPLLRHLLDQGCGIIYKAADGYRVKLAPRTGFVSLSVMLASPETDVRAYKGPKIKGWEQAFEPR